MDLRRRRHGPAVRAVLGRDDRPGPHWVFETNRGGSASLAPYDPGHICAFWMEPRRAGATWLAIAAITALAINSAVTHAAALGVLPINGIFRYVQVAGERPRSNRADVAHGTREIRTKSRAPNYSYRIGAELPDFNAVTAWLYAE